MTGPRSIEKYIEDNQHNHWCECGQHRVQSKGEICPTCLDRWRKGTPLETVMAYFHCDFCSEPFEQVTCPAHRQHCAGCKRYCPTCSPCPGDGSHYFRKDEAPCRWCKRYLTEHEASI